MSQFSDVKTQLESTINAYHNYDGFNEILRATIDMMLVMDYDIEYTIELFESALNINKQADIILNEYIKEWKSYAE